MEQMSPTDLSFTAFSLPDSEKQRVFPSGCTDNSMQDHPTAVFDQYNKVNILTCKSLLQGGMKTSSSIIKGNT